MQQTNFFTLVYRIVRTGLHVLAGILIVASIWPLCEQATRIKHIQWWSQKLLKLFNMRTITTGNLPDSQTSNTMFLANHVSWIDIHSLNSIIPLQFIAKSDIDQWPVLGYLVRKSGTIFIDRTSRKDTSRITQTTTERLLAGANVGIFPEGTTTDGTHLVHFKSSIVQSAINANATIQPVAIRYPTPQGEVNTKMAYAGETTLGECIMNILRIKQPIVELHFLAPINSQQANRQALTKMAYEAIAKQLNL